MAPFPIENRYVAECAGKKFDNYVEWLGIVYAITLACCPALSLPCGFTASGLPVGLQMVAPPRGEARLLAGAKVLEDILGVRGTTPIDPRRGTVAHGCVRICALGMAARPRDAAVCPLGVIRHAAAYNKRQPQTD